MATAKKETRLIPAPPIEQTTVTLTLSSDEAFALAAVLAKIGGPTNETPRGLTSGIGRELASVGFHYDDARSPINQLSGGLTFHVAETAARQAIRA